MMKNENELMHFGVRGMKWGVRKASDNIIKRATSNAKLAYRRAQYAYKRAQGDTNEKYGNKNFTAEQKRAALRELTKSYIDYDRASGKNTRDPGHYTEIGNETNRVLGKSSLEKIARNAELSRAGADYIFGYASNYGSMSYESASSLKRAVNTGRSFAERYASYY